MKKRSIIKKEIESVPIPGLEVNENLIVDSDTYEISKFCNAFQFDEVADLTEYGSTLQLGKKGDFGEYIAVLWLARNGYEVFKNSFHFGPIDIIAIKNNKIILIDVKSGTKNKVADGVIPLYVNRRTFECSWDKNILDEALAAHKRHVKKYKSKPKNKKREKQYNKEYYEKNKDKIIKNQQKRRAEKREIA